MQNFNYWPFVRRWPSSRTPATTACWRRSTTACRWWGCPSTWTRRTTSAASSRRASPSGSQSGRTQTRSTTPSPGSSQTRGQSVRKQANATPARVSSLDGTLEPPYLGLGYMVFWHLRSILGRSLAMLLMRPSRLYGQFLVQNVVDLISGLQSVKCSSISITLLHNEIVFNVQCTVLLCIIH